MRRRRSWTDAERCRVVRVGFYVFAIVVLVVVFH
jgi:hypothetical protein